MVIYEKEPLDLGNLPLRPFVTSVNGTTFRPEGVLDEVTEGLYLELEGEPDNEADPNAVKVLNGDVHIGYIPAAVAARMDPDEWDAVVVEVFRKDGQPVGVRLECRPVQFHEVEF